VRLASFNILHGRSLSDGEVDIGRFRDAVTALDADVLGLQEVDRDQPRSHLADLTAEAAAAIGGEGRFAPAILGTPGEKWRPAKDPDPGGTAYGIGLVTRLPVRRWLTVRLPSAPVRAPVIIPGPTRKVLWLRDEPRVLVAAVLETEHGPLTVANTHLSFVPGWNGAQLRRAARAVRDLPAPRVLMGDLNLPGALPRWLTGWTPLAQECTFPAGDPRVQLDHILLHGGSLPPVVAAGAREMPLSDHRALIVDLGSTPHDGMTDRV
jgi:endonuclease/exonuclease/phosphatase family metal-dependent hydrolase